MVVKMKFLSFLKRLFRRKSDPKHPLMQHSGSASVSASINSHTFDPTTHDLVYDVTSNRISRQTKEETRAGTLITVACSKKIRTDCLCSQQPYIGIFPPPPSFSATRYTLSYILLTVLF